MKKLMIAATAAAIAAGGFAMTCVSTKVVEKDPCTGEKEVYYVDGAGTAHKVAITLKTTGAKTTVKKVSCSDPECTYYRDQKTVKISGLIWEQLDDCTGCVLFGANSAFWTNDGAIDAEFAMGVGKIGKADKNGVTKKVEAYGTLAGDDFGALSWAGFGTLASTTEKNVCEDDDCAEWVKSISGGIAGQLVAPGYYNECQDCDLIVYAGCCDDVQLVNTAAYGTIKISYDTATAKKVAVAEDDQDVASFTKLPKAVAAEDIVVNEVAIEE